MNQLDTRRVLEIEPRMILEIATGLEDPERIAARYGFDESEWLLLRAYPPFVRQVDDKKAELKASGHTFRIKAAVIAEELLGELYLKATEPGASFNTVLETAKFTAKAAGYDAPPKEEGQTGPAFTININLGGGRSVQVKASTAQTIDMEVDEVPSLEIGEVPGHLLNTVDSALFAEVE